MALSSTNILFSFLLLLLLLINDVESQIDPVFSITNFNGQGHRLAFERDAVIPRGESIVRLTPGLYRIGRVLYRPPVTFWHRYRQLSFETTITMEMHRLAPNPIGQGMTFFIVPFNSTTPTGGNLENLGIYDAVVVGSPVFAVEFDLHCGPLDPDYPHIGINFNSIRSQNITNLERVGGTRVTARITYDAPTRMINVVANYGFTTATVSYRFNLAALLPQQVQLGLSASTSDIAAFFDVFTWSFNSTMGPDVNTVTRNDTYIKQYI